MLDTIIILLLKLKLKLLFKTKDYLCFKDSYYKLCDRIDLEFENVKNSYKIKDL